MKEFPTKPGIYIWFPIMSGQTRIGNIPYVIRVYEDGRFWCPLTFDRSSVRGSFVEVSEETLSLLRQEASEYYIDMHVQELAAEDSWDRKRKFEYLSAESEILEKIVKNLKEMGIDL